MAYADLNRLSLPELYEHVAATGLVSRLFELARDEDLGPPPLDWKAGDPTSMGTTTVTGRGTAVVRARKACVVSGVAAIGHVLDGFCADVDVVGIAKDGQRVEAGAELARLDGQWRGILAVERTVLNTVGRLSGIATRTAEHVELIRGSKAVLLDTRKTTPGLRGLEKYAVRCGGGHCHRMGLYDAVLIKDNHLAGVPVRELGAFLGKAIRRARNEAGREGLRFVEVEVDSLEQLNAVLAAEKNDRIGVQIVLVDNMGAEMLREAVRLRDASGAGVLLEASGGITSANLAAVAATGIDRISLGTLTHGATSVDVGLDEEGGPERPF